MSPTDTHPPAATLWTSLRESLVRLPRWITRIAGIVLIVALVLVRLEILSAELLGVLVVVLVLGMLELVVDTRAAVDTVSEAVRDFGGTIAGSRKSLLACWEDLGAKLGSVPPGEPFAADHLALDLSHAWNYLEEALIKNPHIKDLRLRLLMLTGEPSSIGGQIPKEVVAWCSNSGNTLVNIRTRIASEEKRLRQEGRQIEVIIKQYSVVPRFHGVHVTNPFETRYVSFCSWKRAGQHNLYDWGEFNYHQIDGDRSGRSLRYMAEAFDGEFEHLWTVSGEPVVHLSTRTG